MTSLYFDNEKRGKRGRGRKKSLKLNHRFSLYTRDTNKKRTMRLFKGR